MSIEHSQEYPYALGIISRELNRTISDLEANLEVFTKLLNEKNLDGNLPDIYHDLQRHKLMLVISQLKESRTLLDSVDWL